MSLFSKLFNKKPEQTARQDEKSTTPFWDFDKMTLKQFYNKEAAFRHPNNQSHTTRKANWIISKALTDKKLVYAC